MELPSASDPHNGKVKCCDRPASLFPAGQWATGDYHSTDIQYRTHYTQNIPPLSARKQSSGQLFVMSPPHQRRSYEFFL